MNKNELVKTLKKQIQDIYSIINGFENSEQFHLIDIDLALSKVRNLYELIQKLNIEPSYKPEYQEKEILTKTKQVNKEVAFVPEVKQVIAEEKPIEVVEETVKEPELIIEETPQEEKPVEKKKIEEEPIETEKISVKKQNESSPEIVADKFQSKTFVHDNISKKGTKKVVSAKLQSKPINDINSAIGLNDKFIFIRELFGGDKDQYSETIQILNNFDTFENAVDFLEENFGWDAEDPNFDRLKELVRRKYS